MQVSRTRLTGYPIARAVSAFSPTQQAAFQNTNSAATAFGLTPSTGTGMPAPTTFAGGVQGYSSLPLFQQSVNDLAAMSPQQWAQMQQLFPSMGYGPKPMVK